MRRAAPTVLVIALLAATAASFAVAERLKLEPSPIADTRVDKVFSPVCECADRAARIEFSLGSGDRLTVTILDDARRRVATVVSGREFAAGPVRLLWDGRDDGGRIVPEGRYQPRVELDRGARAITLPNPIRVDTTPPRVLELTVRPRALSPDGDGRGDRLQASYRLSEPATPLLFIDGERRVKGRFKRPVGSLSWYGKVGGEPVPEGVYGVTLVAEDLAGNRSERAGPRQVRVRYVALEPERVVARPRGRFEVAVDADAPRVRWRLGAQSGTAPPGPLRLRAPAAPGRHALVVAVGSNEARAVVVVRGPSR